MMQQEGRDGTEGVFCTLTDWAAFFCSFSNNARFWTPLLGWTCGAR